MAALFKTLLHWLKKAISERINISFLKGSTIIYKLCAIQVWTFENTLTLNI